ncbi:MAG: Clp protease N-terminal domain-containing protein, partial [Nitrospinota bacterium]
MFDRFTERARRVVVLAREEAERFNHEYLGTEHLLLGIVKEGGGVAVSVIQRLGVDLDYVKNEFDRRYPVVSNMIVAGDIPFTTMARKVLEFAIEDAKDLGHNYVGTEHLLLGLMRGEDSLAYRILNGCGLTYQGVRKEVTAVLLEPASKRKKIRKTPALDEFG